MKKAVITILGTVTEPREGKEKAKYYFSSDLKKEFNLKKDRYTNMLPLIVDNFKDYGDIKSIYTNFSKEKQISVLKYEKLTYNIEENGTFISENSKDIEAQYPYFLSEYNKLIEKYNKVIIDVSHGFRHFPILSIINLIIQNIKSPDKIEHILFAKEIKQYQKYEIIDLKEYLELANLSFVITNFKDNYTISKHIKIKFIKYQALVNAMDKFSSDIMSLSIENLLDNSARKLKESITDITDNKDTILLNELKALYTHIDTIFTKQKHRYITYYELAKVLKEKGYLIHSLALIFEAIGFYLKTNFKTYDKSLEEFINKKESDIKSNSKLDYYKLIDGCRSFLLFEKCDNKNKFFDYAQIKIIYNGLRVENIEDFKKFVSRVKKLRNNLLHANSGNLLNNTQKDIDEILNSFEKYCINDNHILSHKKKETIKKPINTPLKKATKPLFRPIKIVKKALK